MNTTSIDTEEGTGETAEPSFDSLPLGDAVRGAIDEMGFVIPTPVQLAAYAPIVAGRDLIVQARTGTGKTAAFGIPLVDRLLRPEAGFQALVLAPTRELALQSSRELARIGARSNIQTAAVYGGAPMDRQVRQLADGAQIVSGTPGRVLDHLRRGTMDPSGLLTLVLDEADEMLSMGFAKELNAIMELLPSARQTLLFSATVEENIQRVADRHMTDPEYVTLSSDQVGARGINHFVYFISGKGRASDLIKVLEVEDPESALIFCNTKAETEQAAAAIQRAGFNADWLNGDLPQGERERIMSRTRKGELRFMVATDVAARGIDISHLTHVINYSFPPAVEQYIHRTGRTGRAGRTGTAISLISAQELGSLYYLRLQYKIFPVERSLPTAGEERTRKEADRITLLEQALGMKPDALDVAVARRLVTHARAEELIAGLLSAFFGGRGDDVDEEAAATRRSRMPSPSPEPKPEPPQPAAEAPPEVDRTPRRRRTRGSAVAASAPEPHGKANGAPAVQAATPMEGVVHHQDASHEVGMTRLYVNVGKRDGVRASDMARLVREKVELGRGDLGRIRIRDKHTFVDVKSEHADTVIETLNGQTAHGRELLVEPAKSGG